MRGNNHKYKIRKAFLFWLALSLLFFIFIISFALTGYRMPDKDNEPVYGLNFSKAYAESFDLDAGEVYLAMLDELQVKRIRMPSYWNEIEKEPGNYNFDDLDWYVNHAAERDVELIMVLGQRQPRWPECHFPEWAEELTIEEQQEKTLEFIKQTVEHYQYHDAITIWQVENEPLLSLFGECPEPDMEFLKREVDLVKRLDPSRPILITESGELSTWQRSTQHSDYLGFSLYELVWNQYLGFLNYPMTPGHYRRKLDLLSYKIDGAVITELQTEPWAPIGAITDLSISDQMEQIDDQEFARRAEFAEQIGVDSIYFWGVEWWYWLKQQNHPEIWEKSKFYLMKK